MWINLTKAPYLGSSPFAIWTLSKLTITDICAIIITTANAHYRLTNVRQPVLNPLSDSHHIWEESEDKDFNKRGYQSLDKSWGRGWRLVLYCQKIMEAVL